MAKKKSDKAQTTAITSVVDAMDDTEYLALCLTEMVWEVAPKVNKGSTFELILAMLREGVGQDNAPHYGKLIRSTIDAPDSREVH